MTTANLAAIAELDRRAEALARAITLHHNARAATIECSCFHSERGDDDATSDLDAAAASTPIAAASSSRPAAYTPATAAATLAVLRSQAKNWLPLLLNAFVSSPPSARAPAAAAIASRLKRLTSGWTLANSDRRTFRATTRSSAGSRA